LVNHSQKKQSKTNILGHIGPERYNIFLGVRIGKLFSASTLTLLIRREGRQKVQLRIQLVEVQSWHDLMVARIFLFVSLSFT